MNKPNRQAVLINGGILFGAVALIVGATQSASAGPSNRDQLASARTTLSAGPSSSAARQNATDRARAAAAGSTPLSSTGANSPTPVVLPPMVNPGPAKQNPAKQNPATIVVTAPAPPANAGASTKKKVIAKPVSKPAAAAPAPVAGSSYPEHADIANAIYAQINSERAENGLGALSRSGQLNSSAHGHNVAMANTGQFSHQVTGEASLGPRITATGYHWTWAGENIAWGSYASVAFGQSLESQMYNEPPNQPNHRANILSTSAHSVGVDVITDGTGKMWITCDFGS
jgi:uncharacterized protein YkwD